MIGAQQASSVIDKKPAVSTLSRFATALSVDELARRCRQETENFLAGRPYDDGYGLELFRRALCQHDQAAWQAIYAQYETLVASWVQQHSKFQASGEEVVFFVNAAFARFWRTLSRRPAGLRFASLGQLLRYLKVCTHSAIQDECRRWRRWARASLAWDDLAEVVAEDGPSVEARAIRRVAAEALAWTVLSRLQGQEEVVVAELSWMQGLHPREIRARRPDLFADVGRIYQVKRNIVSRLLRDPVIRQLRPCD